MKEPVMTLNSTIITRYVEQLNDAELSPLMALLLSEERLVQDDDETRSAAVIFVEKNHVGRRCAKHDGRGNAWR